MIEPAPAAPQVPQAFALWFQLPGAAPQASSQYTQVPPDLDAAVIALRAVATDALTITSGIQIVIDNQIIPFTWQPPNEAVVGYFFREAALWRATQGNAAQVAASLAEELGTANVGAPRLLPSSLVEVRGVFDRPAVVLLAGWLRPPRNTATFAWPRTRGR